jgi:SARP family transcriptional regulator, regulator of embCAB operon
VLRIYLTGELALESGSVLIREDRLPRRQGRLAFAYLVSERVRSVSRDELAELLWPGVPPAAWEVAISALVSKLRALLVEAGLDGNVIATAFGCYQLRLPAGAWIDTEAALESLHESEGALRADDPARAYPSAVVAAAILRRPFLPGADGPWIESRRAVLEAALLRALDCLTELHCWNREPALALRSAEEAVRMEPYREPGYQRLMRAHLAAGNRAGALRVYQRCRRLLAKELGTQPSPETDAVLAEVTPIS